MSARPQLAGSSPSPDRLPPFSDEAEKGVLGCLLVGPDEAMGVVDDLGIDAKQFYDLRHQQIFSAIKAVWTASSRSCDILLVVSKLKELGQIERVGGMEYVSGLQDVVPNSKSISHFATILIEKAKAREILRGLHEAIEGIHDGSSAEDVRDRVRKIADNQTQDRRIEIITPAQAGRLFVNDLERRAAQSEKGGLSGIATGFPTVDRMTDGLQKGTMTIIGARPSAGKSALLGNIARHACIERGVKTLFITLEMSVEEIQRRLCADHCSIHASDLKKGRFNEGQARAITAFHLKLVKSPMLWVDGTASMSLPQVQAAIRRARKDGVELVVVDYLQMIRPGTQREKRHDEVAEISKGLKSVARGEGVSLITACKVNRENTKGATVRPPRMSDLGESGQIEFDADLGLLIHRFEQEEDMPFSASLEVAKQRDGECGVVSMNYTGKFLRFTEFSKVSDAP